MCGENIFLPSAVVYSRGSPPRVRGKPTIISSCTCMTRITPACAGKTPQLVKRLQVTEDHPRVCGENNSRPAKCLRAEGSPPRVRGKLSHGMDSMRYGRITPACAGKTRFNYCCNFNEQDHPRVCGENPPRPHCSAARRGSPPRVRGKLIAELGDLSRQGITPACAGKTLDFG